MELSERLDILKISGVLSAKNYNNVVWAIKFIQDDTGVTLTEENASAFVTHLCMALERIDKCEKVCEIDPMTLNAAKEDPCFAPAMCLSKKIQQKLPQIEEAELNYLCIHLGTLISSF